MEPKKKKMIGRLNLFDAVVIVIAVILAIALLLWKTGGEESEDIRQSTVTYTVEISSISNDVAQIYQDAVGTALMDGSSKYDLGTVTAVEITPQTAVVLDQVNGVYVNSPVPGKSRVRLTITADCVIGESNFTLGGGYVIRAGNGIDIKGEGYVINGSVLAIERGAETT